ncbi:MAG: sigma-70 family RNA polymerase sigma factor [Dehalococcoidales bacterium]|nr:sigma-70 family RNA polymerase sigma factor [Dehalococcoidales bacterium]MDX9986234.1 sigma-70 family RNA polymerase sigma factor [Dehalococcoidales bacterium]NLE90329.1 sigma-70 family RNA polymerase sigma factor [Dehalococcoidales bacterium]
MNEQEEENIIRQCQVGNKEAFDKLIANYQGVLFGTAYSIIRERCGAEDAVQEALVKIWQNLPSFRFEGSIKFWMVRIVANEVKQAFRKKKFQTVPFDRITEIPDSHENVEEAVVVAENRKELHHALSKLPLEQREVLVLRYFVELTVPEIASIIGKPEGTVKSRLSRALRRLNQICVYQDMRG